MYLRMLVALAAVVLVAARAGAEAPVTSTVQVLSDTMDIDGTYLSMDGPTTKQGTTLLPVDPPELLWVTGGELGVVQEDGVTPLSHEFVCHSYLRLDAKRHDHRSHNQLMQGTSSLLGEALLVFVQGHTQVRFPPGFGIPVFSNEPLQYTAMALNENADTDPFQLRFRADVDVVRDHEAEDGLKPLFQRKLVVESHDHHEMVHHRGYHWKAAPGRQVNRSDVTKSMQLPFATTIHYISIHLHPYAESLALRDLTTGETLFEGRARNYPDRIGIADLDVYSSADGIAVYPDHRYELVSVYDNTTSEDRDAMAFMRIYMLDKNFRAPGG